MARAAAPALGERRSRAFDHTHQKKQVLGVLNGIFTIIRAKTPFGDGLNAFGYIAGGIVNGVQGGFDAHDSSAWLQVVVVVVVVVV